MGHIFYLFYCEVSPRPGSAICPGRLGRVLRLCGACSDSSRLSACLSCVSSSPMSTS